MLKGVYIRQFQSLREASLQLGKLTVVLGTTDVGKSAFLRAIRAAVDNRRGDSFIYDGAKECQVSLITDVHTVTWHKLLKKSASYYIDNSVVTQEMALSCLGIREVELSKAVKMVVNFQNQLDAPFLLSESDIVKSKVLGEITNAGLLLFVVASLRKQTSANYGLLNLRSQDIAENLAKLSKYSTIETVRTDLAIIIARLSVIKTDVQKLGKLELLNTQLTNNVELLSRMNSSTQLVRVQKDRFAETKFSTGGLDADIVMLQKMRSYEAHLMIHITSARKAKFEREVITKLMPDTTALEQLVNQLNVLLGYRDAVDKAISTIKFVESERDKTVSSEAIMSQEISALRAELRVCPLCDAPLVMPEQGKVGLI